LAKELTAKEAAYLTCGIYGALQKVQEVEKLHEYLSKRKHEVIVEVGTCHGGMTWFLAHLPNFKKIISVDLPGSEFGGGPTPRDLEVIRNWVSTEYDVTLCTGNSQIPETVKEVADELGSAQVDVLFIDADHSYDGVKKDFELWSPLVRNGGTIIFHDVVDHAKSNPACQVKKFWDEIRANRPMGIFFEIVAPDSYETKESTWAGIGIMEV